MLDKPRILSLFPNTFNKFNKTGALMLDPLYSRCEYKSTFLKNSSSNTNTNSLDQDQNVHSVGPNLGPNC